MSCGKVLTSPTDFGSHGGERKAKEGKEATGLSEAVTSVGQPLYVGQLLLGLFELFDQVIAADHLLTIKGSGRQVSGVSGKIHHCGLTQSTMMSNTSNDVYSRIYPQMYSDIPLLCCFTPRLPASLISCLRTPFQQQREPDSSDSRWSPWCQLPTAPGELLNLLACCSCAERSGRRGQRLLQLQPLP